MISLDPKMLQLNTLCEAGRHQCIVMNAMKDVRTKVNIFSIIIMMTIISSGQIDLGQTRGKALSSAAQTLHLNGAAWQWQFF